MTDWPLLDWKLRFSASLAEDLLAQWIRGKQPIAAGMPVGWIARVGRVVDDDYADGVCPFLAVHHAPIAASAPGAVARLAGGSQVVAIDVRGIALRQRLSYSR